MHVSLNEIEIRHAKRKAVTKRAQELLLPIINDPDSVKEHQDAVKKLQTEYAAACWMVEADIEALLAVCRVYLPTDKREESFKEIVSPIPIDRWIAAKLAQQADQQSQKRNEIDGQLHVGDKVFEGKVQKGKVAKLIDPEIDLKQEAKEATKA